MTRLVTRLAGVPAPFAHRSVFARFVAELARRLAGDGVPQSPRGGRS